MAEQSGFFDAHLVDGEYDRVYLAEHFAKYFASFIGNGIFGGKSNELQVREKETASMGVRVLSGQAWIDGYWYENDDEHPLTIDIADGVLHRIDSVVVRWNHSERIIRLAVKKGVAATNPVAPIVQRDDDYYELKLADIYIKAGTTSITQSNITDKRLNTSECGLVIGVIQQLDAEEFGIQLETYISEFIAEHDEWKNATQSDIEQWAANMKASYNSWYTAFKTDSQAAINKFLQDNQTAVNTFISGKRTEIDNMVAAGNKSINDTVAAGEAKLNKTASDGAASIQSVVTTGQQNIAKVVSDGTTNINKVVSDGTTNINKVVSEGTTKIDNVVTKGTNDINTLITNKTKEFDDIIDELEQIAADNDLVDLTRAVNTLKENVDAILEEGTGGMGTEDEVEVGCFYVETADGTKEWINPPNRPGVEYRLTERWNGNPVYQKVLYVAALPNKTLLGIEVGTHYQKIISVSGFAIDNENLMHYPFPIIQNGLTPIAVIQGVESDGGDDSLIVIQTNEDISHMTGYLFVKYTKA